MPTINSIILTLQIILVTVFLDTVLAVTCNSCMTDNMGSDICSPDCSGDMCYLWKSSQGEGRILGCLSGLPRDIVKGCQKNDVGAIQCLCDDKDLCNVKALENSPATAIPARSCRRFQGDLIDVKLKDAQDSPPRTCNAAICFYHKTRVETLDGSGLQEQENGGCFLPDYAFDYMTATIAPGPGAQVGACYSIQFKEGESTLGCICNEDDCNKDAAYPLMYEQRNGPITCHLSFQNDDENFVESGKTCRGQYCMIQKGRDVNLRPMYSKGCLTVSRNGLLGNTGYRRTLDVEQWVCTKDRCNIDIITANDSSSTAALRDTNSGLNYQTHSISLSLFTVIIALVICVQR